MNKSKAKDILDSVYKDVSIANLERRKREIIADTERYLARELPRSESYDTDAGESDDYAGDFEEDDQTEDWNDE